MVDSLWRHEVECVLSSRMANVQTFCGFNGYNGAAVIISGGGVEAGHKAVRPPLSEQLYPLKCVRRVKHADY